MKHKLLSKAFLVVAFLMASTLVASATTKYVRVGGSDSNNGNSWATAYASLTPIFNPGATTGVDSVYMEGGTYNIYATNTGDVYTLPANFYIKGSLTVVANVTAGYDPINNPSILDFNSTGLTAGGPNAGFGNTGNGSNPKVQNLTMIGLKITQFRQGVNASISAIGFTTTNTSKGIADNAVLTFQDMIFLDNGTDIHIDPGTVAGNNVTININNSSFLDVYNTVLLGSNGGKININNSSFIGIDRIGVTNLGGLVDFNNGTPTNTVTINGSSFCNGYLEYGAGIHTWNSHLRVNNSSFRGNVSGTPNGAPGAGGLTARNGTDAILDNVIFYKNENGSPSSETAIEADISLYDATSSIVITNSYMQGANAGVYASYANGANITFSGTGNHFNNISTSTSAKDPGACPTQLSSAFTFNCGSGSLVTGSFIAGTASMGVLRVPINATVAGPATLSVNGMGITSNPAPYTTYISASTTYIDIPVNYDGTGTTGTRSLTVTSSNGTGTCSINVAVAAAAAGTIDCAKTQIFPAPVQGTASQLDLMVTVNVTTLGKFTPTVSGSGMSLANASYTITPTATGIQTFHIPIKYDGSTLGTMTFGVAPATPTCTADLTKTPKGVITNIWTLDCVPTVGPTFK